MKKFIKVLLCLLMVCVLAGCGESYDKQEAVVNDFFSALKDGDITKLKSLCTSDNASLGTFSTAMNSVEGYLDEDTYGTTFVEHTNQFIKDIFGSLVENYEITDTEKDGDDYVVTVSAKMKNYNNLSIDQSKYQEEATKYQKEHLSELQKIYLEKGQKEMMYKIYGDLAETIFSDITEQASKVEAEDVTAKFTLTAKDDGYLISKIE